MSQYIIVMRVFHFFILAKLVDKNPAGEITSRQQRRPRGLFVTCRAQKTKSPISHVWGREEARFRVSPRKHPKRDSRGAGEGARLDRGDKRGKEERNGCTGRWRDGRTDRQTDMEGMKIIIPGGPRP